MAGRKNAQPRGRKDGTREDNAPNRMSGGGMGTSAFGGNQGTTTDVIVRGDGMRYEFDGLAYFSYNQAPVRQDRIQAIWETRSMNLLGWDHVGADTTPDSSPYSRVPALQRVEELWEDAYEQMVFLAEARDAYRHLPASLNDDKSLRDYVELYMTALIILIDLISWQKLAVYDFGHRAVSQYANKISRGRVDGLLRQLTSHPMLPAFHTLALWMATPVTAGPESIVYHPNFLARDNLLDYWGIALNNTRRARAGLTTNGPNTDSAWTDAIAMVEQILMVLDRSSTGTSSNKITDIRSIQGLFRMLGIQPHLTTWRDLLPIREDPTMLDQLLYRGTIAGYASISTGDKILGYPTETQFNGNIEMRGQGQPNPLIVAGMANPVATSYARADEESDQFSIGLQQYGGAPNISGSSSLHVGAWRKGKVYTQEDGWIGATTIIVGDSTLTLADPFLHHQYVKRLTDNIDTGVDVRVNDTVDWQFFMPLENVGIHYLKFIGDALGVPYV